VGVEDADAVREGVVSIASFTVAQDGHPKVVRFALFVILPYTDGAFRAHRRARRFVDWLGLLTFPVVNSDVFVLVDYM
jgi:hypothetical protein